jgi:hypothetical protein
LLATTKKRKKEIKSIYRPNEGLAIVWVCGFVVTAFPLHPRPYTLHLEPKYNANQSS